MSNIGKTGWANRLAAQLQAEAVECDRLIEEALAPELKKRGYNGLRDMAKWLGQPYESQYPETSRVYLAKERAVLQELIARLKHAEQPMIISTTGSVIHAGEDIAEQLRTLTRVVYLEAAPQHVAELFERYIAEPKPVIWGDSFAPRPGEAPQEALKRCYPQLLNFRAEHYAKMAHVKVPFEKHHAPGADPDALIDGAS
jgi:shikimate kinase